MTADDLAFSGQQRHNHVTRDIKPVGKCPACDEYWERTYSPQKAADKQGSRELRRETAEERLHHTENSASGQASRRRGIPL